MEKKNIFCINKNINDMTSLTIYYIISKLREDKQIIFF